MNAAFIHVPKTGGLTVEAALGLINCRNHGRIKNCFENEGRYSFGHMSYIKLLKRGVISQEFHNNAFKFAFCRNPYDRAVSHWCYVMKQHPQYITPGTSFLDFSRQIYNQDITKHFRHQWKYVDGVGVNYQARFENFLEELDKIAMMIGVRMRSVPHNNKTNHKDYWEYYCKESKERIETFYKEDFEYFGYDYDNDLLHRSQRP